MQKQILFVFLLSAAACQLPAQTKWIAHKSHSGSDAHFEMIAAHGPFDDEGSNYGKAPDPVFRSVTLDTVVFLSDSVVVLKSSEYYRTRANGRKNLWRTVRDTVGHHPLFSSGYSLKEIKRRLKEEGYYENPVSSIKFIAYKKAHKSVPPKAGKPKKDETKTVPAQHIQPQQEPQKQDNFVPLVPPDNYPPPASSGFSTGLMVAILAILAAFSGLFSWLQLRLKRHEKLV